MLLCGLVSLGCPVPFPDCLFCAGVWAVYDTSLESNHVFFLAKSSLSHSYFSFFMSYFYPWLWSLSQRRCLGWWLRETLYLLWASGSTWDMGYSARQLFDRWTITFNPLMIKWSKVCLRPELHFLKAFIWLHSPHSLINKCCVYSQSHSFPQRRHFVVKRKCSCVWMFLLM